MRGVRDRTDRLSNAVTAPQGAVMIGLSVEYPSLVLFDIDGTLLRRAGPHHREALEYGIRRVTGLETTTDGIPLHGMLDLVILRMMMRRAGAKGALIREAMPHVMRAAERRYLKTCPELTSKTCPGVRGALGKLSRRGVLLGLVTGNLTRIGWHKLDRAGLKDYFRFGAFGEMAPTRTGLVRIALREARRRGWIRRGAPVALIGDAPADVIAARGGGARSIAVRTGVSSREELEAERPGMILDNLLMFRLELIEK
jgi:phosphoglycolate phosphatase